MIYKFLRRLTQIALLIYFRKIYINGAEKIPKNQAFFLAANHPNGFVEPLLLGCFLKKPLHYLVRGDMFENKWLKPLLLATNQIPIYRGRDGFSNLRQNQSTFSEVYRVLDNHGAIVIFVEGTTEMVKHLRPLQKGMARMALRAHAQMPEVKPVVIPVALNFCHAAHFRSEVMVDIGDPIPAIEYAKSYLVDKKSAVNALTKTTFTELRKAVIEIPEAEMDHYDQWLLKPEGRMPVNPIPLPAYNTDRSKLERLRYNYYQRNKSLGKDQNSGFGLSMLKVLLYPLYWFSIVFHAIPLFFTNYLVHKLMTRVIFQSALRIALGLAVFVLYYLVLILGILIVDWSYWWVLPTFWLAGILSLILDNLIYNTNAKLKKSIILTP